eukprot:TRINITY_DN4726_c0_g1_i1.p1 TRINITY_DN4726_c0_g1~~TRINITY_DN4726_c0_g1_i1.p1  ORF type:complete len:352 (-),score=55.34 TRINITY_DN4726_c0_g1_i1:19-1074(-)
MIAFFFSFPYCGVSSLKFMCAIHEVYDQVTITKKAILCHFVLLWITNFFVRDFDMNICGVLPGNSILLLTEKMSKDRLSKESSKMEEILMQHDSQRTTFKKRPHSSKGIRSADRDSLFLLLTTYPIPVIAEQMTRIDGRLFSEITADDLAQMKWTKTEEPFLYPKITNFINRFNSLSKWVPTEIVRETTPKSRKRILKIMIDIAIHLFVLKNYHAAMAIVAGLHSIPSTRCVSAWKILPRKYRNSLDQLEEVFSHESNYTNYRKLLEGNTNDLIIPFFGLFMKDLIFWNERYDSPKNENLFNFHRMHSLGKILFQFESLKQAENEIGNVREVSTQLENLPSQSEDALLARI